MTTLLWCVVCACVLPYLAHGFTVVAKRRTGRYERHLPRIQSARLEGWGARAWAAQQNAWEALAVFAPIALVAHGVGVSPTWSGGLGAVWVLARLGHLGGYVADVPTLRSVSFGIANLCVLGLVVLAASV